MEQTNQEEEGIKIEKPKNDIYTLPLPSTPGLHLLEGSKLKVFVGTWNLQGKCPLSVRQFRSFVVRNVHHIYAIGTQECERSIKASLLNTSKKLWESKVTEAVGDQYVKVASNTLLATHIIVFIRKDLCDYISGNFQDNH